MRTRRRLLADATCIGAALLGASMTEPFFSHFLEGQDPVPPTPPVAGVTKAYPSDGDAAEVPRDCTEAYPSDSDCHEPRLTTCAHPSDDDTHEPRPRPAPRSRHSSLSPFWARV
ncbi:MAG: microviridin/marinostatin family tricyclic proteinase inhibitor [Candidatus Eremiobacterota bacterium]